MGWKTNSGGTGSIAVPSDLEFSGANLAACQTARDAFFTANPARKSDKVRVLLKPTGAAIVLQQWDAGVTTWRDQTAVVRGPQGNVGPVGTKASLGLDRVDNTNDLEKPLSTAEQAALALKADKTELALKADIDDTDAALLLKLNISDAATLLAAKQATLVSGTNLKTVNGESLLGAGNIALAGGSGMTADQIAQLSRLNSLHYAPVDVCWTDGTRSNATDNITGTAPNTVDGITLAVGMRVLHATGGLDGIYEVTAVGSDLYDGSWVRAADMRAGSTFTAGASVFVRRGTRNAGKTWSVSRFTPTGIVGSNLSTWETVVTITGNPTPGQVPKGTAGATATWGNLTAADVGALAAALRGTANGVASLGADSKLKLEELPDSIVAGLKWQGTWNAATNTPTIPAAAVGNNGFFYRVATAGNSSVTGSSVAYAIGDWLISNGNAWQRVENTLDLVNDLTTGGTGKALAAAQGPALKTLIDAKPDLATAAAAAAGTAAVGVSTKAAREDHVHPAQDVPALATAAPLAAGTANVGTSTKTAREDHVHPAQTLPTVVNDLTTGGAAAVLSAEQGKILAGRAVAPDWTLPGIYEKNALVRYSDGLLYIANEAIPTTTAWSVGTSGLTWRAIGSTLSSETLDIGCYRASTAQALPNNVDTKVTFASPVVVKASTQWNGANSRFVITKPGTYRLRGKAAWAGSPSGGVYRSVSLRKNGSSLAASEGVSAVNNTVTQQVEITVDLVAGDYIELYCYQATGASVNSNINTAATVASEIELAQQPTSTVVSPSTITATNTPTAGQIPEAISGTQVTWKTPAAGVSLASAAPLLAGTAAVGTGTTAARADHVHPRELAYWDKANIYAAGDRVLNRGVICEAVAAVVANTDFKWGTTGAVWKPVLQGNWTGPYTKSKAYAAGDLFVPGDWDNAPLFRVDAAYTAAGGAADGTAQFWTDCINAGGVGVSKVSPLLSLSNGIWYGEYTMAGATATLAGRQGMAPKPGAGDQDKLLCGGGFWTTSKLGATMGKRRSAVQSITSADNPVVMFNADDPFGSNNAANSGLTYDSTTGQFKNTSGKRGTWQVSYVVSYAAGNASGNRLAWIMVQGDYGNRFAQDIKAGSDGNDPILNGSATICLDNDQYFEIRTYQDSGVSRDIGGGMAGQSLGYSVRMQACRMFI